MADIPLEFVDRLGTNCVKWDLNIPTKSDKKPIYAWVADSELAVPAPVHQVIMKRASHPVYGYPSAPKAVNEAIQHWIKSRFNWDIQISWITLSPGVCTSMAIAIQAFSQPGDIIVTSSPIYFPCTNIPEDNGRRVLHSKLIFNDETKKFEINFKDLEAKLGQPNVKIYLLVSPHNPAGRIFTRDELLKIAELCLKNKVTIISDEIHWDFDFPLDDEDKKEGESVRYSRHIPLASLSKEISDNTILLSAPSKTFNLPALQLSYAIVSNPKLKQQFDLQLRRNCSWVENPLAFPAVIAAYTQCSSWVDKTRRLYRDNFLTVKNFFLQEKYKNLVDVVEQEATFLLFLNFNKAIAHFKYTDPTTMLDVYPFPRNTDIVTGKPLTPLIVDGGSLDPRNPKAIQSFFFERIAVMFNEGSQFGLQDGDGWARINLSTDPKLIQEIVHRVGELLDQLEEEKKAREK
ncbi:MAG: Cystathionine beta-lyase [Streblomastix strix]|uniref:cysteine-S-conjugate beta-lyase n=1 Tax=Streblomastix strix TaxID=222440 RepID=A0A5J4VDN3_9EUKA|nr:MAG: Cystathionine beta-lyase [Streblomastix strix]